MAQFIVRVELHDATSKDYDALHAAMAAEGFGQTVRSTESVVYQLPTAEYYISVDLSTEEVRGKAKVAAGTTGKKFSILVTKAAGFCWSNLTPA